MSTYSCLAGAPPTAVDRGPTAKSVGDAHRTWTTAPGRHVVLYDGKCRFCTTGIQRLLRWAGPGAIEALDFQQPGVLERFPGITHAACMQQMQLVTPTGRVYAGFEAAVRALATRALLRPWLWPYYILPVRFLLDQLYAFVAANRYRLWSKQIECPEGTCALHSVI